MRYQARRRMQCQESGFTLIELLVVVVIVGLLATIAIPAFLGQREKAEDAEAKAAVRTAMSAAKDYSSTTTTLMPAWTRPGCRPSSPR